MTAPTPSALAGRFETNHVTTGQSQFGCVFDGDDALAVGDDRGQRVQQRGLARSGTAADDEVGAIEHGRPEERRDVGRTQRVEGYGARCEAAHGDARTVDRQGRDDDVDSRSVGQAGIDEGTRAIDAQAEGRHHALDEEIDGVAIDADRGGLKFTATLDPHRARTVDHHLGDQRIGEQRFERPESGGAGEDPIDHPVEHGGRRQRRPRPRKAGHGARIGRDRVDQLTMHGIDEVVRLHRAAPVRAIAAAAPAARPRRPRAPPAA